MTFWYKKPNEPDHWNKRPIVVDEAAAPLIDWRREGEGSKKRWEENNTGEDNEPE
jgi:hypothetical protein